MKILQNNSEIAKLSEKENTKRKTFLCQTELNIKKQGILKIRIGNDKNREKRKIKDVNRLLKSH